MQRLRFKKSIADAAVDGVVPEGHLRTPAQAYQDVMAWLERLDAGEVEVIVRPKIVVPLPDTDPADLKRHHSSPGYRDLRDPKGVACSENAIEAALLGMPLTSSIINWHN